MPFGWTYPNVNCIKIDEMTETLLSQTKSIRACPAGFAIDRQK